MNHQSTRKDFTPIWEDYLFFESHATELAENLSVYLHHFRQWQAGPGRVRESLKDDPLRLLDFGCGSGLLLGDVLERVPEQYAAMAAGKTRQQLLPMFKALELCPDAVIVKPRIQVYAEVSRAIRAMMEDLTPDIEPLSLDEAFLDVTASLRLFGSARFGRFGRATRCRRSTFQGNSAPDFGMTFGISSVGTAARERHRKSV